MLYLEFIFFYYNRKTSRDCFSCVVVDAICVFYINSSIQNYRYDSKIGVVISYNRIFSRDAWSWANGNGDCCIIRRDLRICSDDNNLSGLVDGLPGVVNI